MYISENNIKKLDNMDIYNLLNDMFDLLTNNEIENIINEWSIDRSLFE